MANAEDDNLDRLGRVMESLDAQVVTLWDPEHGELHAERAALDATVFHDNETVHLLTREGRVDVLQRAPEVGADFLELAQSAELVRYRGLGIPVASVADLIRMKEAAGRPKDREDLRHLYPLAGRELPPPQTDLGAHLRRARSRRREPEERQPPPPARGRARER